MTMTAEQLAQLREVAERAASDDWGYDRDEFYDVLTPEMTLALLDELESTKRDSARWFKAFEKAVSVGARYEERIAELEARTVTVKLPTAYDLTGETDGNCYLNDASMQPDIDGCYFRRRDVESACAAAGINLTVEG